MATRGSKRELLVDTSVAVALSVADHEFHALTLEALEGRHLGLAGHALFETFSVLTRLPPPARRPPAVVARLLRANFPVSRFLSPEASAVLVEQLGGAAIAGDRSMTHWSVPWPLSIGSRWRPTIAARSTRIERSASTCNCSRDDSRSRPSFGAATALAVGSAPWTSKEPRHW